MNLSNLLPIIDDACGLHDVREQIGRADQPPLLGVNDAAKAPVIAALTERLDAPALVIVAKPARALELIEELPAWLGDRPVAAFPERDSLPYERLALDTEAVLDRLRAVATLRAGGPAIVVASAVALAQRTLAPESQTAAIDVRTGERHTPDGLVATLLRIGYRPAALVEQPGDVARRGGLVDVFPAAGGGPLRIEFVGDRVESLRGFDPESQRSQEPAESAVFTPAREVLDVPEAARALAARLDFADCTVEVRERFEGELARLEAGDAIAEEGFYVPFLTTSSVLEHLPQDGLLIVDERADITQALAEHDAQTAEMRGDMEGRGEVPAGLPLPHVPPDEVGAAIDGTTRRLLLSRWATSDEAGTLEDGVASARLPFAPADAHGGRLRRLATDVADGAGRGRAIVLVSQQAERVAEVLSEEGVSAALTSTPETPRPGTVTLVHGSLPHGWRLTTATPPLTLLTDAEIFGFVKQRRRLPRSSARARDVFLAELSPGDYVVHMEHGIARFAGMVHRTIGDIEREYLELRYDHGDKLYVPADQVDRVSRYVGPSDRTPGLTRLGSQEWTRAKERARRAVADLAKSLLELYASRQLVTGRAFSEDTPWQRELEASFPYVETPDQLAAVEDVKADMATARPMDRLICGDVGYGKTEVALRAAFKAVMDGTQVAVLVPTTVLAQQHFSTFSERLSAFPVRVEVLSRFRSDREQREIVAALAEGGVDIVIGTHRLLQQDIAFKELGLVIIDEEQRFGVAHKERLKQMRREVDVLTLTATPIPRTLHMSLSGIRDMSTMETPPEQRHPIKTYVAEYDDRLVREAILRELERGGQVYFLHNRVQDIERVAGRLRELLPEAEIAVGHGQQHEDVLEQVMLDFVAGRSDVLVCTTIIESGLDIPNVNTIIIDRADRLGLAQLYQLRGRVGRGAARAYAYLLFPRYQSLTEPAQKRLQVIFEATELGAGFQIALRDLEIRGAGNLLGAEQSGQIGAVGFDLYVRLLADAVETLKALNEGRTPPAPRTEQRPLTIDLPFTAHLPPSYVGDLNLRLALYQRLAAVETEEQAGALAKEIRERFGPPPPAAENLMFAVRVRALALQAGVSAVQQANDELVVHAASDNSPQVRLRNLQVPGLRAGPTQARLRLPIVGEGWQEALIDVLEALGSPDESDSVRES